MRLLQSSVSSNMKLGVMGGGPNGGRGGMHRGVRQAGSEHGASVGGDPTVVPLGSAEKGFRRMKGAPGGRRWRGGGGVVHDPEG